MHVHPRRRWAASAAAAAALFASLGAGGAAHAAPIENHPVAPEAGPPVTASVPTGDGPGASETPQVDSLPDGSSVSYIGKVQVVTSTAEGLPVDLQAAIQRDLGMSPQDYLYESAVSVAASKATADLEERFPEQITGVWTEGSTITIGATSAAAQQAVRDLGVTVQATAYSRETLEGFAQRLIEAPGSQVLSAAVDPRRGGLTVSLAPGATLPQGVIPADVPMSTEAAAASVTYADSAPNWSGSDLLRNGRGLLISAPVAGLNPDPNTWRPQAPYPTAGDSQSVFDAWAAAATTYNNEVLPKLQQQDFETCSMGVGLKGDGSVGGDTQYYVSTAGHCFAKSNGTGQVWPDAKSAQASLATRAPEYPSNSASGTSNGSFGPYLGTPRAYQIGSGTTMTGASAQGTWPGGPQIDAAVVPVAPASGLAASNLVWTYPTTKTGNPQSSVSITGVGTPNLGDNVCHSGTTSGWHCGPVTTVNALIRSVDGSTGSIRAFQAEMCAANGDSGGATIMGTTSVGLVQGGSDPNAFKPGTPDCDPAIKHFTTVTAMPSFVSALQPLGLRVLQNVAPPSITTPTSSVSGSSTTVSGRAVAGDTVRVYVDGKLVGSSLADATTGAWSVANVPLTPGSHTIKAQSHRDPVNFSSAVTRAVSVASNAVVVYKTPTSDALYTLSGSGASTRATHITFEQWAAAGFPAPRAFPSAYVKYSWSDDLYAVNFWNTAPESWTWQRLTPAQWAAVGYPKPGIAGWITGTQVYKYATSDELFASLNGKVHKLSFAEWQAMNFAAFTTRTNQGFVKTASNDTLYKVSSLSANLGAPVTFAQWAAEGFPTPRVVAAAPRR
ncbi:hypothetical protein JT358_05640 [Micrococcales bacterium 31B]|nr:hypothetical protein [Micrococcales bacterium 31B]